MIRRFWKLCKTILNNLTDVAIFQEATDKFSCYDARCPHCGATGKLTPYGSYPRHLVSYEDGAVVDRLVWPLRFDCGSCDTTHALLPDILVPYSPYSLRFKLLVLVAYFERDTTVLAVCECFGIAVSTLYAWKKRLLEHKDLLLGMLTSKKEQAIAFLHGLFVANGLSVILRGFFQQYAFSFLQNRSTLATHTRPP